MDFNDKFKKPLRVRCRDPGFPRRENEFPVVGNGTGRLSCGWDMQAGTVLGGGKLKSAWEEEEDRGYICLAGLVSASQSRFSVKVSKGRGERFCRVNVPSPETWKPDSLAVNMHVNQSGEAGTKLEPLMGHRPLQEAADTPGKRMCMCRYP